MREFEVLGALRRDTGLMEVVVRMARLARRGRLGTFLAAVGADGLLGAETKRWLRELGDDPRCLFALETWVVGSVLDPSLQSAPAGD